jgi:hypothetical protein
MKVMAATMLLLTAQCGFAHRLDEYLVATIVSVEKTRVQGEITLTPGVAVYRIVLAGIDKNGDGVITEEEERAYAGQVLRDLSVTMDGRPLTVQLRSKKFPSVAEMREGRGEIRIEFGADVGFGGTTRKLAIENRHQSRIAAYQVNCLVPGDPGIRIVAQDRNYSQSVYQLTYQQAGSDSLLASWAGLGGVALVLFARLGVLWRRATWARV